MFFIDSEKKMEIDRLAPDKCRNPFERLWVWFRMMQMWSPSDLSESWITAYYIAKWLSCGGWVRVNAMMTVFGMRDESNA